MSKHMQLTLVAFVFNMALAFAQYAVNCDFENDDCPALTTIQTGSDQKFIRHRGGTPSMGTGPSSGARDSVFYIYLEASDGTPGNVARLYTDQLNTAGTVCVEFDYHMYGIDIERLSLWTEDRGVLDKLWSLIGEQGNIWMTHRKQYTLTSSSQMLVFEARRGFEYKGDIALDNIKVYRGTCDAATTMGTTTTTATTTLAEGVDGISIVWACDFDKDFNSKCQIAQDEGDDRDWKRTNKPTPSNDTGPSGGYGATDGSPNYYYFMESSHVPENNIARFYSPLLEFVRVPTCARLKFFYSMYGLEEMGTLEVSIVQKSTKVIIFSKSGNQGIDWIMANNELTILSGYFRICFEATRGSGFHSDIAVDEIQLIDCTDEENEEEVSIIWKCDLDDDYNNTCQIAQDAGDDYDWTRTNQPTPSSDTGPSGGYGASDVNPKYYFFMEASGVPVNATARFYSPTLKFATVPTCAYLEFFYSMYGLEDMGSLEVSIVHRGSKTIIFSKSGDQGIYWIKARADVAIPTSQFRICFEAKRGSGYHSDIAVDEIQLIDCTKKESTPSGPPRPTPKSTTVRPPGATNVHLQPRFVFIDHMPGQVVCTVRNTARLPFTWKGINWYDSEGHLVDKNKPGVKVHTVYSHSTTRDSPNDFWASTLTVDSADYTLGGQYSCEVDYDDEVTIRDTHINIKGCPRGDYMCKRGGCIPCNLLCDGYNDCGDYSDEFKCGTDRGPLMSMGCTEN